MNNNPRKEPRGEMFKKDAIKYLIRIKVIKEKESYGKREKCFIRRVMKHGELPRKDFIVQGRRTLCS